jgi:hypothetical protein
MIHRPSLARLAMVILLGIARSAHAQPCTDYANYLHWKSTVPLGGLCNYVVVQSPLAFVTADLLNGKQGFHVLNIENPEQPSLVGSIQVPGVPWRMIPAGKYVYVTVFSQGLLTIDVSDPANPTIVGSLWTPSSIGLAKRGDFLYLCDFLSSRMFVVSVEDPRSPELVGELNTPGWAYDIAIDGDVAVITAEGGVMTADVTDPLNPRRLGSCVPPTATNDVAIAGSYAFIAGESRVYVADIADPTHPSIVAGYPLPRIGYTIELQGRYAYIGQADDGLTVLDIQDPLQMVQVGHMYSTGWVWGVETYKDLTYVVERYAGVHVLGARNPSMIEPVASLETPGVEHFGIVVQGDFAFVGDTRHGVNVADVSDPLSPRLVTTFNLPGMTFIPALSEALLYVPNGYDGLRVMDMADPEHPSLLGTAGTGGIAFGVDVEGRFAYVANSTSGLCIVDVDIPSMPVALGHLDLSADGTSWGVAALGEIAYVTDSSAGLAVVDVSNPLHPQLLRFVSMPFQSQCVQRQGNLLYVGGHPKGLAVLDITEPEQPAIIGYCDTLFGVAMVRIKGETAWLAEGQVQIADVSNPRAPRIVGYAEPPGRTMDVGFKGRYALAASNALEVLPGHCPVKPVSGPLPPRHGAPATALMLGNGELRIDPLAVGESETAHAFTVLDASGRVVRAIADAGTDGAIAWDGNDESGRRVPSGVYFLRKDNAREAVRRVLVVR